MFVGEIGFPRQDFLHDLLWWEVKSIVRGYNARHHAGREQARFVAYNAHYSMGVPAGQTAPNVSEWITFPWERKAVEPMSQSDIDELLAEINAINAEHAHTINDLE